MNNGISNGSLLRMVGLVGIGVGIAWALQILGFSTDETLIGRVMWTMSAAALAGASFGLVVISGSFDRGDVGEQMVSVKA